MYASNLENGTYTLRVEAEDQARKTAFDEIRFAAGFMEKRTRAARDQDNPLDAWPEHGLLGTQLGPNKNGKKW
jgi:hypothetical protein